MIDTAMMGADATLGVAALEQHKPTSIMKDVEDILYGSIAGIVGKYVEYPFDTVKVRLQSQPDHLPLRYTGPIDCFRQSFAAEGLAGLYRGISAPLFGAAVETSSLFLFEGVGRDILYVNGIATRDKRLTLPQLYVTGAFAGVCTSFVLTPIELVKCRIQAPSSLPGSSVTTPLRPWPVLKHIVKHHGIRGLWHGQMGTLIREGGGSAAWFGAKETVTIMFHKRNNKLESGVVDSDPLALRPLPLWQQAVAGASAGVSYNFLFFPADTIKSRMQTMPYGGLQAKRTFWGEGAVLWRQHGLRGMYRGCGITCLRSAPSSALIFMVYDGLKQNIPLH